MLAATFTGHRRALDSAALRRALFAFPLVTLKIVAAIHWEALRLWLKGCGWCRARARAQYRLGEWEEQRLYFAGVVDPRPRLKQGRSAMPVRADRRSMDRPCPS